MNLWCTPKLHRVSSESYSSISYLHRYSSKHHMLHRSSLAPAATAPAAQSKSSWRHIKSTTGSNANEETWQAPSSTMPAWSSSSSINSSSYDYFSIRQSYVWQAPSSSTLRYHHHSQEGVVKFNIVRCQDLLAGHVDTFYIEVSQVGMQDLLSSLSRSESHPRYKSFAAIHTSFALYLCHGR